MKYLVAGPSYINNIEYADGSKKETIIGGSIYCVAGIKLWCDDCLYISNVGKDFSDFYGPWMNNNNCSYNGLNAILPHTQYTTLKYGDEGLHDELSIYGLEEERLAAALDKHDIDFILKFCGGDTKGIYIEANEKDPLWDSLDKIRSLGDIKIMWELPTSITTDPARHEKALDVIKRAGLYSINIPEAKCLFHVDTEGKAIESIVDLNVPCYLRAGKKGSYMICGGEASFSASVNLGNVVDTTGCGNCSTAAALYGYCEGYAPEKTAFMGNIAAAYNLLQYGPYPHVINARKKAVKLLEA
jgi:sugar/nucleoside kinase (ribokinase family)